jgi:coenzyme F420 biosynthesis associated uncharacterized protein
VATPIDFALAARIAAMVAGEEEPVSGAPELARICGEAEAAVRSYTGLEPEHPIPAPEWLSRREWAQLNLDAMQGTLEALGEALGTDSIPGPLQAPLAVIAGAQLGTLVGYASRRVLGQYEFPLLGPSRPPRLVFVAANVAAAESELGGGGGALRRWIALHEVTHAVHFSSVPWLTDHLRGLARELLESTTISISAGDAAGAVRRLVGSDPRTVLRELRASDPLTLLAPVGARETLASTQATMAVVEGFAEHVMDAAAPALGDDVSSLRTALETRRDHRPPLARLLGWLLGMELKLRQYRDGKQFCDGVVEAAGVEGLSRAWDGPSALPTLEELSDPPAWVARTAHPAVL